MSDRTHDCWEVHFSGFLSYLTKYKYCVSIVLRFFLNPCCSSAILMLFFNSDFSVLVNNFSVVSSSVIPL